MVDPTQAGNPTVCFAQFTEWCGDTPAAASGLSGGVFTASLGRASLSRVPAPMPAPSPPKRAVTRTVPMDTLRARSTPFSMAMSSGATVFSAGPSPPPATTGHFGPPQAATLSATLLSAAVFFALFGRSVELLGLHTCVLVQIDIK